MRDRVISPRFEETSYKGQDVVHQGIRVPLHGMLIAEVYRSFSDRAQEICDKKSDVWFRPMVNNDLGALRLMWFDQDDETFPNDMEHHVGVTAMLGQEIVGGAIWAPQGKNLFMHQLVAGEKGKELQVPTRLIWASVQEYWLKWHALDIGVSYNPKRYAFFRHFDVETYPIILKRPEIVPVIRLTPFKGFESQTDEPFRTLGDNSTFFPRGAYALEAALRLAGVGEGDYVSIVKTFGSQYISGCVTKTIEKLGASWVLRGRHEHLPKAIIAIHEFGIPVFQEQDETMLIEAAREGVTIIEDNAWNGRTVFAFSTYTILSMTKMYDVNYGGILFGASIDDETLWSWGLLDTVKRDRYLRENGLGMHALRRADNWRLYNQLVIADGMTPDDCYDYAAAIDDGRWIPTVYLQKFESNAVADAIVARLEDFGIQAGRYWGEPIVFLPIHQSMTTAEVEYMFAVVRGYFNLCRDYGK